MTEDIVTRRYTSGEYAERNPDWDTLDSPWKADRIVDLLVSHALRPASIVEIGCGSGGVLACLRRRFPDAEMAGFDIAPGAGQLWQAHAGANIRFVLGDYFAEVRLLPDLILVLDVLEHLGNPFDFLARLRGHCKHVIFHFPLDLSAASVIRESPLLHVRDKVGHLHYFTKGLALALLNECGFEVIEARYTGAALHAPQRSLKTRLAGLLRRLVYAVNRDVGARLLGGETLMVLARPRRDA
ncbi:MAG: methyltransferase domain-containing protein [Rhodocyclaceae bacterium]|nr:methyltransferase domain-containing protein [Rhodocyclaceae bacterium]